jgi:hypothetical protein
MLSKIARRIALGNQPLAGAVELRTIHRLVRAVGLGVPPSAQAFRSSYGG